MGDWKVKEREQEGTNQRDWRNPRAHMEYLGLYLLKNSENSREK